MADVNVPGAQLYRVSTWWAPTSVFCREVRDAVYRNWGFQRATKFTVHVRNYVKHTGW